MIATWSIRETINQSNYEQSLDHLSKRIAKYDDLNGCFAFAEDEDSPPFILCDSLSFWADKLLQAIPKILLADTSLELSFWALPYTLQMIPEGEKILLKSNQWSDNTLNKRRMEISLPRKEFASQILRLGEELTEVFDKVGFHRAEVTRRHLSEARKHFVE